MSKTLLPKESSQSIKLPVTFKISAKKTEKIQTRIAQGDIFQNIRIIEDFEINKDEITVQEIEFPYIICLNQECDLESDYKQKNEKHSDATLLHLAIAPVFNFEHFLSGNHWGGIFENNKAQKRGDTTIKKIMDNEIPRYHYLKFPDDDMPELIIDFKHFFTINKTILYNQIWKRFCSMDDLFKEKINQRFSYYISRIGLPEYTKKS